MEPHAQQDKHLLWSELDRESELSTPVFSVQRSRRRAVDGREADYYLLDTPDWVNVVPVVEGDVAEFIMVRQFRHGSGRVCLEFPGGVIDPGETPEQAARRELLEETGHRFKSLTYLGSINPNPAIMSNRCHTFVAEGCEPGRSGQDLDEQEIIDVERVPIRDLIRERFGGVFDHAMMQVALTMYLDFKSRNPEGDQGP